MTVFSKPSRLLALLGAATLAACQTVPTQPDTAGAPSPAQEAAPAVSPPAQTAPQPQPQQSEADGVQVVVLHADTSPREGWMEIPLREGSVLYVNPEPLVTRNDLSGVQAGAGRQGEGLLALDLRPEAIQRVTQATTQAVSGRLALVVGRTLMAAPTFDAPVTAQQLVFAVGSEQNAMAAAKAIAGVDEQDNGQAPVAEPAGADSASPAPVR